LVLILDIDATLADSATRVAIAGPEPSRNDKDQYDRWLAKLQSHASLLEDDPIEPVCELARVTHAAGHKVIYLTARSEQFRLATERWLAKHDMPDALLIHRENDDYRTAGEFKIEHVLKIKAENPGQPVIMVDDDPDHSLRIELEKHGIALAKIYSHTGDRR
jgi:hypothetical protein